MGSFLSSQVRFRRRRALALGAGVLVAAASFVLLTSAAQTSSLRVHGTLSSAFRPAYDILVRPPNSPTPLERSERLVRPNYLSGIFGGISLEQWQQVERLSGVAVAAPIANIGYLLVDVDVPVRLNRFLTRAPFDIYRIRFGSVGEAGASKYPAGTNYVYYTHRDPFISTSRGLEEVLPGRLPLYSRASVPICGHNFTHGVPGIVGGEHFESYDRPFVRNRVNLYCYSARSPTIGAGFFPPGEIRGDWRVYFPVLVAAVDPEQEARLLHLEHTLVAGRYFRANEGARIGRTVAGFGRRLLPGLVSARTFVDENVVVTVERLGIPPRTMVPARLAARDAYRWVATLRGHIIDRQVVRASSIYGQRLRRHNRQQPWNDWFGFTYWTPGDVTYRQVAVDRVAPRPLRNPWSIWLQSATPGAGGTYWNPPMANADAQFRRLSPHVESPYFFSVRRGTERIQVNRTPEMEVVGSFDPQKLPGFSPLSKVPLETYYPPVLEPADPQSREALHGKQLRPTSNMAGYIQQPPLVLTTLKAARWFYNQLSYTAVHEKGKRPISVIRVRVKGVTGPDPLSLERIRVVAQKIHDATGLAVDITAGSSPHPLLIDLPAGKFGRPPLLLREGWSKKGVTVSFLRALDRKDLALFALILAVCAFFLGNGALAAVQARRAEIGTLLTLGWSRFAIFAVVLGEILLVGMLAGVVGTGIAALLAVTLALHLPLLRALLVLPIAVGLALVAGSLPAWLAARGTPLDALRPPVVARRRARPVHRLASLALVNLVRVPARTLLGVAGLMVGVTALTILLAIELAFQGTLVGTVLGNALSLQVRGTDFAAVGLTIALAGLSVADVLYLNLRERAAELVTLRTLGWSDHHTRVVVVLEGLALGLLGSVAGALVGLAVGGLLLDVPLGSLALASLAATVGGTAAAAVASLLPLSQLNRLAAPAVLAAE